MVLTAYAKLKQQPPGQPFLSTAQGSFPSVEYLPPPFPYQPPPSVISTHQTVKYGYIRPLYLVEFFVAAFLWVPRSSPAHRSDSQPPSLKLSPSTPARSCHLVYSLQTYSHFHVITVVSEELHRWPLNNSTVFRASLCPCLHRQQGRIKPNISHRACISMTDSCL